MINIAHDSGYANKKELVEKAIANLQELLPKAE
jgi:hypothetical protein